MEFDNAYQSISKMISYSGNDLTYGRWLRKPDDQKSAFLFINFFKDIKLAWRKAAYSYVDECRAVETVLQYLEKNVGKIKADPDRYTGSYIYVVCRNCIRSLNLNKGERERSIRDTSFCILVNGDELNGAESIRLSITDSYTFGESGIFDIVAGMGVEYEKLAYSLIGGQGLARVRKDNPNCGIDPLSDVTVAKRDAPVMILEMADAIGAYIRACREDLMDYIG